MALQRTDFTIGWICALPIELAAAVEMLDEEYDLPDLVGLYTLGRIGQNNIVIAGLPAGQPGIGSATAVAMQLQFDFKSIHIGVMVGIAGGVPGAADVRLGDVVVGRPNASHGGVIQYDFGRTRPGRIERTGFLNAPPQVLLNAAAKAQALHVQGKDNISDNLAKIASRLPFFGRNMAGPDCLYQGDCPHDLSTACTECDIRLVERPPRPDTLPKIHYGTIASGNMVMRDGRTRDQISNECGGVLCFEMEAAGLMNFFPCLVIRGICDYADSHKKKDWQPYASATAAAYTKDLLMHIPAMSAPRMPAGNNLQSKDNLATLIMLNATDTNPTVYNTATFGNNNSGVQVGHSTGPINFTSSRR